MNSKLILLMIITPLVQLPCLADDYLVFLPGQTKTSQVWFAKAPIPGTNVVQGCTVVDLTAYQNGSDSNPNHYTLQQDGSLCYTPPPSPKRQSASSTLANQAGRQK